MNLYDHFRGIHKLTSTFARRLIEATQKKCDPRTTKLVDNNEDIIDYSCMIECPFKNGNIHLFDCQNKENIQKVPCKRELMYVASLKSHLLHAHRLPRGFAHKISQYYKDNQTRNH